MKGEIAMDKNVKILFRTTPEEKKLIEQKAKKLQMNRERKIFCVYGKNSSLIRNRYVYMACRNFCFFAGE